MTPSIDINRYAAQQIVRGPDAVLDAVTRLTPQYERPEHMRSVAEFFAGVARREQRRLVLSSAPRFGKSETIAAGIAWLMLVKPGVRIILVSCTSFLAEHLSRNIRQLVERLGLKIPHDQRALEFWQTSNGSSLRATSTGSALVGVGCDVLICDDLVPSLEAAHSPTQCIAAEQWFESTALGRLEPGGSVMVCAHRWSIDDISGRLIDRGWDWANVPAIDPATGQSSWPSRWTTAELREKERLVGPLAWLSLYAGTPAPRGGAVFIGPPTTYDPLDVRAKLEAKTARIAIACDPAGTATRTSADWSVVMVGAFHGYGADLTLDVLDVWRGQVEIPELVERLIQLQRRWGAPVGVEGNGVGRAVPQYLRRAGAGQVLELRSTTDKLTRSMPTSAAWARGSIRWPPQAHWLPGVIREITAFNGLGNQADDTPDCLTHLWTTGIGVTHAENNRRRVNRLSRLLPFP